MATSEPSTTGSGTGDPSTSSASTGTTSATGTTTSPGTGTTDDPSATDVSTTEPVTTTDEPTTSDACTVVDLAPERSYVALAIDRTWTTSQYSWDHDGNAGTPSISRWNSIYNVMATVLEDFEDDLALAAALFPAIGSAQNASLAACKIAEKAEVPMAFTNADEIVLGIPGPMAKNDGGTAMRKGLINALSELEGAPPYAPRAVVVITDGAPLCAPEAKDVYEAFEVYDQATHTLVADAFMQGIPTYVIGIQIKNVKNPTNGNDGQPDGINNYQKLNELAVDGGKPVSGGTNFHHCNNEADLTAAVQEVLEDAKSCNVVLPEVPSKPDNTVVEVGGVAYPHTANLNCDDGDGWIYIDDTHEALRLCGSACTALKSEVSAAVTIGC